MWSGNGFVVILRSEITCMDQHIYTFTSFHVALSTPHSIHTSQCSETVCAVYNSLVDLLYKYLLKQDELYEQYMRVYSQCDNLNVDCDLEEKLEDELRQVSEALYEVEKVLRIPQLDPYNYNKNLCR